MRILFLTNFYPPHELGGQGRSCQQVVEGLKQRGHDTLVLTSRHGIGQELVADGVHRTLYLEMELTPLRHSLIFFTQRRRREQRNLAYLEHLLAEFRPDLVFVWGMWNLSRRLPALAEILCPGRVAYRFAEYWPTLPSQHELYWQAEGRSRYGRILKEALGRVAMATLAREIEPPSLQFNHAICVSAATRDKLVASGVPVAHARIIHTGLDEALYVNGERPYPQNNHQGLKLLYAGRLSADKGVETAVEAMAHLVHKHGLEDVSLSFAGSGSADYTDHLQQLVKRNNLDHYVTFLGWIPFEEMPPLMRQFDALILPSRWPEPFARVVLEGMMSELVVIATSAGGTGEIVCDGQNGLLFTPDNSEELACQVVRLAANPQLRRTLAEAGRQTVKKGFTSERMLDQIESYLQEITGSAWNHRQ